MKKPRWKVRVNMTERFYKKSIQTVMGFSSTCQTLRINIVFSSHVWKLYKFSLDTLLGLDQTWSRTQLLVWYPSSTVPNHSIRRKFWNKYKMTKFLFSNFENIYTNILIRTMIRYKYTNQTMKIQIYLSEPW